MRRTALVLALAGGLTIGGMGIANAHHIEPDTLPANIHGMCTSTNRGSNQGIEKKNENSTAHQNFAEWVADQSDDDNNYDADGDGFASPAEVHQFCIDHDTKYDADKANNGNQNVEPGNGGAQSQGKGKK